MIQYLRKYDTLGAALLIFAAAVVLIALNSLSGCTPAPQSVPPVITNPPGNVTNDEAQCRAYHWKDRGVAPRGYMDGVATTLKRSICLKRPVIAQALGDTDHDALAYYGLKASYANTYALLLGLGMRESSGNYTEGYDTSAGQETASEAEAGAFQFSYNSMGASPVLGQLFNSYNSGSAGCLLDVFMVGAPGNHQSIKGSGPGAEFQVFTKKCPAFQAEYAATLVRVLRKHFGPLNRKEAEIQPACVRWMQAIEAGGC